MTSVKRSTDRLKKQRARSTSGRARTETYRQLRRKQEIRSRMDWVKSWVGALSEAASTECPPSPPPDSEACAQQRKYREGLDVFNADHSMTSTIPPEAHGSSLDTQSHALVPGSRSPAAARADTDEQGQFERKISARMDWVKSWVESLSDAANTERPQSPSNTDPRARSVEQHREDHDASDVEHTRTSKISPDTRESSSGTQGHAPLRTSPSFQKKIAARMDRVQSWVESLADASPEPPLSLSDPKSCAHRRTSKISPIHTGESSLPSDANHGPTSHHGSGGDLFELTLNTRLVSPDFLLPRSTGVASSSSLGVRVRQKIRLGPPSPIFIPSHSGVPIQSTAAQYDADMDARAAAYTAEPEVVYAVSSYDSSPSPHSPMSVLQEEGHELPIDDPMVERPPLD